MSIITQIENLDTKELAEALEYNGYGECVGAIHLKNIDGQEFLKLTELQISLWRLPTIHARRLWSFIQLIRQDPKQFLMGSKKATPKVSNNNTLTKSNAPSKRILSNNNSTWQISNQFEESQRTDANASTLTKQESQQFKAKLERFFKSDADVPTHTSFIHRQPGLPPKPNHLKIENIKHIEEIDDEEMNDGYLSPIKVTPNKNELRHLPSISVNTATVRKPFLNRYRKSFENLENRHEVVENKYEHQNKSQKPTVQARPLPPIPMQMHDENNFVGDIEYETDEEELADYTPVIEEEKQTNARRQLEMNFKKTPIAHRPLPIPPKESPRTLEPQRKYTVDVVEDEEDIAEYAPVIEDDEIENKIIQRPLPKLPPKQTANLRQNQKGPKQSYSFQLEDDEDLAEYTPVVEDEEPDNRVLLRRPLPVLPRRTPSPSINRNNHSPLLQQHSPVVPPDSDEEEILMPNSNINRSHNSFTKNTRPPVDLPESPVRLRSENKFLKSPHMLPKPNIVLPKPPIGMPQAQPLHLMLKTALDSLPKNNMDDEQLSPKSAANTAHDDDDDFEFYSEIDLIKEPCYREIDRKGARRLLTGLEEGAFLIRPSRKTQYVCTISIMHRTKMFNIGIERDANGVLGCGTVSEFDQPKFHNINDIVNYYKVHPLSLYGESIVLKDILPSNRH